MSSPVLLSADKGVILYEGYLFKTPPLDKFFMKWQKRWFVLSRSNPLDPSFVEFSYYTDREKKDKKKSIDLRQIKSVNPVYNKTKDNVFSVETEDRKFLLKSADQQAKAVWVAKLLEFCSKDGSSYHVTVPDQPTACFSECVLKLTTPLRVNVISSTNGNAIISVPYNKIRRFGCQIAIDSDIVWFETCNCEDSEEFQFFKVASGIEKAYQIIQEYKRAIELALRDHMIQEEGDESQFLYSYVVRKHYGHPEFPAVGRERILQSSLMSLDASGGALSLRDLNKYTRSRPSLPYISMTGPIPGDVGRRNTTADVRQVSPFTRSPSPISSPANHLHEGQFTLSDVQRSPRNSRVNLSASADFDSGVVVDGLDASRHSAPCYVFGRAVPHKKTLEDMKKDRSFDESKNHQTKRPSLAQMQLDGSLSRSRKTSRETDSALGSLELLGSSRGYDPYSDKKKVSLAAYDHLAEKFEGILAKPGSHERKNASHYVAS